MRNGLEPAQEIEVLEEGLALEAWHAHPEVASIQARELADAARKESPPHGAEGHEGNAEFPARVEDGDLGIARPGRILSLKGRNGVHRMGTTEGACGHLGKANRADLTLRHEVGQGPDTLFDRHPTVPAMKVIEVDHVDTQTLKALIAGRIQDLRTPVQLPLFTPGQAALRRQDEAVTVRSQDLPDQPLVVTEPVDRSGVEEGATGVEGAQKDSLSLGPGRWRAIGMGQAHAAQSDLRDFERAKLTGLHVTLRGQVDSEPSRRTKSGSQGLRDGFMRSAL